MKISSYTHILYILRLWQNVLHVYKIIPFDSTLMCLQLAHSSYDSLLKIQLYSTQLAWWINKNHTHDWNLALSYWPHAIALQIYKG